MRVVWWGVGFFSDRVGDHPDREQLDDLDQVTDPRMPEWLGPPAETMPGISGQLATIFKTSEVMLAVRGFEAYATGVEFTLELWVRAERSPPNLFELVGRRGTTPPESRLWFGIVLTDGSAWTNVDPLDRPDDHSWFGEEPAQPTLSPRAGSGLKRPGIFGDSVVLFPFSSLLRVERSGRLRTRRVGCRRARREAVRC